MTTMPSTLASAAPPRISNGKTNPMRTLPRLKLRPTMAAGRKLSTLVVKSANGIGKMVNESPSRVPESTGTPMYRKPKRSPTTVPVEKMPQRQLSVPASLRAVAPLAATGA